MTTPAGTITMQDIQTEFGGVNPIALNEYYSGGAYVPSGLAGVPASGTISMDNLRNKTKAPPVSVVPSTTSAVEGTAVTFTVTFTNTAVSGTFYWKTASYTNLSDADFSVVSGSFTVTGGAGNFTVTPVADSAFEDFGSFTTVIGTAAGVPVILATSSVVTVNDLWGVSITNSRNTIFRYANLIDSYTYVDFTISIPGGNGKTLTWDIAVAGGTLTTADVSSPLTGSFTVTGNTATVRVSATKWTGGAATIADKLIALRIFDGATNIASSTNVTLTGHPSISVSASPTTISEGNASTVSVVISKIPTGTASERPSSIFWSTSGTASATTDWVLGATSGSIVLTGTTTPITVWSAIDGLAESSETLTFTFFLNSVGGITLPFTSTITIANRTLFPAGTVSLFTIGGTTSGQDVSVYFSVDYIDPYALNRTFDLTYNIGDGIWRTTNLTVTTVTVPAYSTSAFALIYQKTAPTSFYSTLTGRLTLANHSTMTTPAVSNIYM